MDFLALISFLSELAANNNKPWFEENRPTYEHLRGQWMALVLVPLDPLAYFFAFVFRSKTLCTIFDNLKIMFCGYLHNLVHFAGHSV